MRGKTKTKAGKTPRKTIEKLTVGFSGTRRARRYTAAFRRRAEAIIRRVILAGEPLQTVVRALDGEASSQIISLWAAALRAGSAQLRKAWKARAHIGRPRTRAA